MCRKYGECNAFALFCASLRERAGPQNIDSGSSGRKAVEVESSLGHQSDLGNGAEAASRVILHSG